MTRLLDADAGGIAEAAALLRAGEAVAIPTETVYGLAADATNAAAVERIYEAKGRPANNPLIVHVPGAEAAARWAGAWSEDAARLAGRFWPGPLTLVVPAGEGLASNALAGGATVGLRAPDHPVALELLRACGLPLAAPSANRSGSLSPTLARHVVEGLGGRIAAVLDGGPCRVGIESTVLDLASPQAPRVLRPGDISAEAIAQVLGRAVGRLAAEAPASGPLLSPGLLTRHYAPAVPLRIVAGELLGGAPGDAAVLRLGRDLPEDPQAFASELYRRLWLAQAAGGREIWLEKPPETPEWNAVWDRLRRAVARD
ncbi:MAG: L-threonylcarbamoyladenylate synthase [Sumerlaeia bacterium]